MLFRSHFQVIQVGNVYRVSRIDGATFPFCGCSGSVSVDFTDLEAAIEKAKEWDAQDLRDDTGNVVCRVVEQ